MTTTPMSLVAMGSAAIFFLCMTVFGVGPEDSRFTAGFVFAIGLMIIGSLERIHASLEDLKNK